MRRTMTKKMMVIGSMVLLLMIPLMMIEGVVHERSSYREEARLSIAQSWTGEQKVVGPLLVVPYKEYYQQKVWDEKLKQYQVETRHWDRELTLLPELLQVTGEVATDERSRGLYTIPVYTSELALSGNFSSKPLQRVLQDNPHRVEWLPAHLSVMVSDVRGVVTAPLLQWQEQSAEFLSGAELKGLKSGMHAPLGILDPKVESLPFSFNLTLRGMERLQFSPVGKSTQVALRADWPHPSFIGRYLPGERKISAEDFSASWSISSFSSGMPQLMDECQQGNCNALMNDTFGVTLFNSVDIYQQSERSVKYAMLFIGLTFTAFFLFEVMKGLRLHPMQYLLVGLGLSLFFLLLITLSEHMAFSLAYLFAALCSTAVIGFYISGVVRSARLGGMITAGLLLLYAMLFGILRSEDNALLMGSLLLFTVLSVVMVVTRRVDWYSIGDRMMGELKEKEVVYEL
jgi:inner membrane protein